MAKGFNPPQKGNKGSKRAARHAAAQEDPVAAINDVAATAAEQGASSPPLSVDPEKVNRWQRFQNSVGETMNDIGNRLGPIGRSLNTPMGNILGAGAVGIGTSVLGNAMSGELEDKGLGRVALEALGAGALGAAVGGMGGQFLRRNAVNDLNGNIDDYLGKINEGRYLASPMSTAAGAAAMLGGAAAAGGLGGLIGGGLSDLTQSAGILGFGSSNTASAKAGMQSTASTAYPADPTGGMSNEEMYLASLGYLPMS